MKGSQMEYRALGQTGIKVSAVCLGTMTWGSQNDEAEAHAQIDYALDRDINFLDTAEMYPTTPGTAENRGSTETIIGNWIAGSGRRDRIVLATKVAGPSFGGPIRGGDNHLDRRNIEAAVEDSLRRLKTDYIDLYQLHWPDRTVPMFGSRGLPALADKPGTVAIEQTLEVLGDLVKAGKVRAFGVSNETPWGVAEFLRLAREKNLPRVASIQNPYSLLNRVFEIGLSEFALREDVGLLAYSPLAAGFLSGKYQGGIVPAGSRRAVATNFPRYLSQQQPDAVARYIGIAHAFGLSPVALALAFVYSRTFVTSSIIGATSVDQLRADIDGSLVTVPEDALTAIAEVYRLYPDPCP
jgi:aryl-alcohol dehydrogenase-like predicted oxidoreductase